LRQFGDAERQRRVGEHSGNDQPFTSKNRHVATVVDMTTALPSIGYLGGTGPAGSALAVRLASVGYPGFIGSRTAERGREVVESLRSKWADRNLQLTGGDNAQAARCDIIVLATPWDSAATTVTELSADLEGKIVITMANALVRVGKEFQPLIPPRGSIAAHVQAAIPKSKVVAAFQHLPATELGALDHEVDSDVLICSDDPQATSTVSEMVLRISGCRPLNAGLLSNALAIEALTAVLLQLNVRYKTRVAPRFTGIK
jgi:NADPH-dependent F420 reductase